MFNKKSNVHDLIMEQIKDVEKCLVSFKSFMAAAVVEETAPATLDSLRIAVGDAENAADISLRAMIDSLSGGSYLPSTREDLISIATSCDKIANKCEDVSKLIEMLQRLCDAGNTVLVIEHNLDVIKTADYVIDLGPEGGDGGGYVEASGTPEEVAQVEESYTGQYLKAYL